MKLPLSFSAPLASLSVLAFLALSLLGDDTTAASAELAHSALTKRPPP